MTRDGPIGPSTRERQTVSLEQVRVQLGGERTRTARTWKSYGLTTADRPDRHAHLRSELERTGLPFDVLVSDRPADSGGFASVGFRGCFESHLSALRLAREEGVDIAILVEDDAVVASAFTELVPHLEQELAGIEWSTVLLGYLGDQSPARHFRLRRITQHVARAEHWEFLGSHFTAVNRSALDPLIADFERRLEPGGRRISVDGVLNEFRHTSGADTLVCVPNLARQGPSPSGITVRDDLSTRLMRRSALQQTATTLKRRWWDLETAVPPSWNVAVWNLRARLTARSRQQYLDDSRTFE
jgi:glycosyl transferase, family 25